MLEKIKKTLNDIKSAIIERGVEVGDCDSPSTYASKILAINSNGVAMAFIPVFKVSDSKPARPTTTMSALNPTNYPDGWGEPDNLSGNIWMSYTLVGNSYVYIPWTDPILINGEYTAPITRTFTIFGQLSSLNLDPSVPVGGTWDVANNRLVGDITSSLSNGNTLTWSTENKSQAGWYTYISNCTFCSEDGKPIGSWSDPYCINSVKNGTDGVGVRSMITYYIGSVEDSGLEAPSESVDPLEQGWKLDPSAIELSENLPYLWAFTRIVYSDDSVWQGSPYIVREYVNFDYQEFIEEIVEQITSDIGDIEDRLVTVEDTDALIKTNPEKGLIKLLTDYADSDGNKRFADFTADAAEAEIKLIAAARVNEGLTAAGIDIDGLGSTLNTFATSAAVEGEINDARTEWKAGDNASITQSVLKGRTFWQKQTRENASAAWVDVAGEVQDYNPTFYEEGEDGHHATDIKNENKPSSSDPNVQWVKVIVPQSMSIIKQTANEVSFLVNNNTGIQIIANAASESNGQGGSRIVLSADQIRLNGNVLANAIDTNNLTITQGSIIVQDSANNPSVVTTITPNGFTANNANIKGTLESTNGFFGTRTYNNNTEISRVGVSITSEGLESSNYSKQDAKGFLLTPNNFEFYSDDGSKVTNTGIVATKVISGDENGMMTEITETGFRIKLNDKPMAFFELNNTDPDNPYVVLKVMGKSGWCELAPDGPHTQNNTTTVYREPKWWEVQLGKLYSSQESIIINYDPSGSYIYLPFTYPTLETYYRYEVGTKTVTENGVTTVWYWDPVASEYILTVPTCNGKIYTRKYVGESQQLEDGLYTNNYNYLGNTIVYPPFDYPNNGYHVYEITFEQYTSNAPTGTTYTVQARKRYTPNSSTLYGGEELETSNYDTSTWDDN